MERKLATIQKILNIEPIEGKDRIVLATVQGWKVIVEKDQFNVGDLCIYCEIDSLLPEKEQYEFLRKRCWVDNEHGRGFRIRTMKMGKVYSQGICFPTKLYINEGLDVTEVLGITKYDSGYRGNVVETKPKKFWKRVIWEIKKVINKIFPKEARGKFPKWVPQTDEDRLQSNKKYLEEHKDRLFYATEKLDGTSATFSCYKKKYYVMSRNLVRNTSKVIKIFNRGFSWIKKGSLEDVGVWEKISAKYNLEERLSNKVKDYAIQGEIIGSGIQGNKYKYPEGEQELFIFGIYDIEDKRYLNYSEMINFIADLNFIKKEGWLDLKMVPVLDDIFRLVFNMEDMIKLSDGPSVLNKETLREGIVYRLKEDVDGYHNKLSFKVISNEFLVKYGE